MKKKGLVFIETYFSEGELVEIRIGFKACSFDNNDNDKWIGNNYGDE